MEDPGDAVLLIHDGELADVRDLLEELGLQFAESTTADTPTNDYLAAPVVVSTPQYLSNRINDGESGSGVRIAIIDDHARTLLGMLSRGGVEWLVRRPFHPAALRGLLLHCLYRGPEKRTAKRVAVGAAVHFQAGWRRRGALLAEISDRDCRILSAKPVAVGKRIKLRLPAELAGRRVLNLDGRVVRTAQSQKSDGAHEICILFDPLPAEEALCLKELVATHERGPAILRGPTARHFARTRPTDAPEESVRRSVISVARLSPLVDAEDDAAAAAERRSDVRHAYRRRVIALSEEATRVLVGRDISKQGMRVDPTPALALGSDLRVALHVPGQETPLVADMRVHRDDGEHGLVLHFVEIPDAAVTYLESMLTELTEGPDAEGTAKRQLFLVSQIVDGESAAIAESSESSETAAV